MNQTTYMSEFVHIAYANLIYAFPLYINRFVFPFESWTITTYDKAVQKFLQDNQTAPKLPVLSVQPQLYPELDESSKQLWRFPEAYKEISNAGLFTPIYKDDDISLQPLFLTVNLRFDLYAWFESVYQKLDFETAMLLHFGGYNRYSRPYRVIYDIPFPNHIQENPDLINKLLSAGFPRKLIKSLNKELIVFPVWSQPLIRVTSIADNSTVPGQDELPEWRSTVTVEMYVQLLTGIQEYSNYKLDNIVLNCMLNKPAPIVMSQLYVRNDSDSSGNDYESINYYLDPNARFLIFEVDRDVSADEWYEIDLSSYRPFDDIIVIYPDDITRLDWNDSTSILRVKGPFIAGESVYLQLK